MILRNIKQNIWLKKKPYIPAGKAITDKINKCKPPD